MQTSGDLLVVAYGHLFANLDIEREVLTQSHIALVDARPLTDEHLAQLGVHGVLMGAFKKLDRELLARLPQCRGIVRYGIGVDNVDVLAAHESGIVVCNVPDYCLEEVAVHCLACSLTLLRAIDDWDRMVRAGEWRGSRPPALRRPSSCCLGIIGFGHIGRLLEDRARRIFGMIKVFDPWCDPGAASVGPDTSFVSNLDELLEQSDVVSVHVPLIASTRNMLDDGRLRKMKSTAFVINASRGGIVNEQALLTAIRERRLAGAALDTFVTEPLRLDDPLMSERRILLSPHIAWKSEEAEVDLRRGAAEEIVRILTGEAPRSPVAR